MSNYFDHLLLFIGILASELVLTSELVLVSASHHKGRNTFHQESGGIIIIIQHLYSASKSCKGDRGAGGFRLRLSEQMCFEVFFKGV